MVSIQRQFSVYLRLFIGFVLFSIPSILTSQTTSGVVFEAQSNAKSVLLGSYFEVSFILKNANGTEFSPPDFRDFTLLAGPLSSNSMQIINGQVSREMGFTYTLQPKKEGVLTVGSATIKANGKLLTSNTISISVTKGSTANANITAHGGEAYIELIPSKTKAFPGEQITLDYKLFTTVSLEGYDIQQEPDYAGFYVQELKRYFSPNQQEVVNGRQMMTKVLRRLALFPQQTGSLTIPPINIQLAMVEDDNNSRSLFFSRKIKPIFIETEPVTITVEELPNPSPQGFTGGVGQFEIQASVNRRLASTDEAVVITLLATGNGDIKRLQPPALLLSDSFEVYPPKVIEEVVTETQQGLIGKKVIEYLALAKLPGKYSIKPSICFFDTYARNYVCPALDPFELTVTQGTGSHTSQINNRKPVADVASEDIRFIKGEGVFEKEGLYFMGSPGFFLALFIPAISFVGLSFYLRSKRRIAASGTYMEKQADKIALSRLAKARDLLQTGSSKAFYEEISRAMLGYACDKMSIPLSSLTKENVREKWPIFELPMLLLEDFMKIIHTCEMALYAGMDNQANMQSTYDKTAALIAKLEESIGTKSIRT